MAKSRGIDKTTEKWAREKGVRIWVGDDGKFYAQEGDDSENIQVALTARDALSLVLKTRDPSAPMPLAAAQESAGSEENNNEGNDSSEPEPSPPAAPPAPPPKPDWVGLRPGAKLTKVKIDKGLNGVQYQIKSRVALDEDADIDVIFDEVVKAGFKTTRGTVMGLRSGVLHTMRVLRAIGMMPQREEKN